MRLQLLLVGLGGLLGALARYALAGLVHRWFGGTFPLGTLAVNVLGCFVLGACMGLVQERQLLAPPARTFLTVGLLGSFTTFSTFGYETFALLRERSLVAAFGNVALQVGAGLCAVAGGWILARALP